MDKKRKKVIIMGLESLNNYGDNFILRCVKYLVDNLDIYDTEILDFESHINKIKKSIYYFILCVSKISPFKILRYKLIFVAVKLRCKKTYRKVLEHAEALIFGCGSLKYGTQKLWAYYSLAIEIANELEIPVMFNAMNIQKYNEHDWRCRFLQEHVNSACVKMITCRDGEFGVKRLVKDYHIGQNVSCVSVGDVAFWIPECYQTYNTIGENIIGINLINGNTFRRYGNSLAEDELLQIYIDLLSILDMYGIRWELFTNGLSCDYKFGIKLLKMYGNKNKKIRVPISDIDLISIISGYKTILGARLHACICAYAIGVPFVGYIWDEKIRDFAKMADIEMCFVEEADISGKLLYEKIIGENIKLNNRQIELRELWKRKTKQGIDTFLRECGNRYI